MHVLLDKIKGNSLFWVGLITIMVGTGLYKIIMYGLEKIYFKDKIIEGKNVENDIKLLLFSIIVIMILNSFFLNNSSEATDVLITIMRNGDGALGKVKIYDLKEIISNMRFKSSLEAIRDGIITGVTVVTIIVTVGGLMREKNELLKPPLPKEPEIDITFYQKNQKYKELIQDVSKEVEKYLKTKVGNPGTVMKNSIKAFEKLPGGENQNMIKNIESKKLFEEDIKALENVLKTGTKGELSEKDLERVLNDLRIQKTFLDIHEGPIIFCKAISDKHPTTVKLKDKKIIKLKNKEEEKKIGEISITDLEYNNRLIYLDCSMEKEYWEQGYAEEVLRKAIIDLFLDGVLKVLVKVPTKEIYKAVVLLELGFIEEGNSKFTTTNDTYYGINNTFKLT